MQRVHNASGRLTRLLPNLPRKKHFIRICPTALSELKLISSVCRFLTEDAAKILVTSCILSRLDYCNCLLTGTPNSSIQPLQKTMFKTLLLDSFFWHPAITTQHLSWTKQNKTKTGFLFQKVLGIKSCFSAIEGSGLAYRSELLNCPHSLSYTTLFF